MSTTSAQNTKQLLPDRVVIRSVQLLTFIAAAIIFPVCIVAATKFASSPFEIFAGVVMGGILSISLVILGLLLPISTTTSLQPK
jgi:hypothetical protein